MADYVVIVQQRGYTAMKKGATKKNQASGLVSCFLTWMQFGYIVRALLTEPKWFQVKNDFL